MPPALARVRLYLQEARIQNELQAVLARFRLHDIAQTERITH